MDRGMAIIPKSKIKHRVPHSITRNDCDSITSNYRFKFCFFFIFREMELKEEEEEKIK